MKMISQYLKRDAENQTAYLDLQNTNYWWNWYGSEVEAHAWYLKLLAAVKPKDTDTRGLVKYLVNNRKHASYWESTRDTAFAIEAIAAFVSAAARYLADHGAPHGSISLLITGDEEGPGLHGTRRLLPAVIADGELLCGGAPRLMLTGARVKVECSQCIQDLRRCQPVVRGRCAAVVASLKQGVHQIPARLIR